MPALHVEIRGAGLVVLVGTGNRAREDSGTRFGFIEYRADLLRGGIRFNWMSQIKIE
jgi:hypothetical protein